MAEQNVQAAVDVVIKDPVAAVKAAASPSGRDFYALSALTVCLQSPSLWPILRDAGVLNVFIELLVDEWTSKDVEATAPGWVFSLTGIINVLVSINKEARSGSKAEHEKQYEIMRSAYPRIEATLWKVHATASLDKLVDVLALGMFHMFRVPDLHRIMYTPHTLGIVGHCWKTATSIEARKVACLALRTFLTHPKAPSFALDSFYSLTPFETVAQTLIKNVFLNQTIVMDETQNQLAVDLVTADALVNFGQKDAARFVDDAKIHVHVVSLLRSRVGAIKDENARWALLDAASPLLNNTINASADPAGAFADLIAEHEFLELGADALISAAPRTDSYNSAWFRLFKILIHTVHCTDASCRVHSTPAFASAIRTSFIRLYIPTLNALDVYIAKHATRGFISDDASNTVDQETDSPTAKNDIGNVEDGISKINLGSLGDKEGTNASAALWQVTLTWRALGAALSVNEEVLRGDKPGDKTTGTGVILNKISEEGEKEKRAGVCWWAKCDTKAPAEGAEGAVPYKRCSGCRCVTYCSAEHQKLDWKDGGHKDVCSIVKNA